TSVAPATALSIASAHDCNGLASPADPWRSWPSRSPSVAVEGVRLATSPSCPGGQSHGVMPPDVLFIDGMGTLVALEDPAPALAGSLARRLGVQVAPAEAAAALRAEIAYY